MLILGIETATEQVGVAIGGHEGVIATFEVAKGRRHAETLTPAIEFVCRQSGIELVRDRLHRGRRRPRPVHRHARRPRRRRRRWRRRCACRWSASPRSTCWRSRCRHVDRVVVPVIDARKSEVFWAMYRPVPGGVQQVSPPTVGSVDDLVGDLLARGQDVLCVGDGAERYRDEITEGSAARSPPGVSVGRDARAARPRPRPARGWVRPDEIEPIYLRAPDAQINWASAEHGHERAVAVADAVRRRPSRGRSRSSRSRSRHLRECCRSSRARTRKPWSRRVFESELRQVAAGSATTSSPRPARRRARRLRRAVVRARTRRRPGARDQHRRGARFARGCGVGHAADDGAGRHRDRRGCVAWTLEVRASNTAAQELYRQFGFAPAGVRQRYYENTEDAIVMWCHDIHGEAYAERLRSIAATSTSTGGAP